MLTEFGQCLGELGRAVPNVMQDVAFYVIQSLHTVITSCPFLLVPSSLLVSLALSAFSLVLDDFLLLFL